MSEPQGRINEPPLAEVLRDLHFDRRGGVLTVQGGGRVDELYFHQGEVFYDKTNAPGERLDQLLVKWGLVPAEQVASIVQRAGQDVRGSLVREGVFPDEKSFDEFMSQVLRERMASVFTLTEGDWDFEEKDVSSLRAVAFDTSTPNVILEGVRRMAAAERVLSSLVADDAALRHNPKPAVPVESLRMGPSEGYVLSLVDGVTTVSAITRTSPLGEGDTLRLLYGLLVLDVLVHPDYQGYRFSIGHLAKRREAEGNRDKSERELIEEEYRRVRELDVFRLLPGLEDMEPEARRQAIKDWQAHWQPSRFSERTQKELRDQLTYLAGRGGEALLAFMDADRKRAGEGAGRGEASAGEIRRMELSKSEAQSRQDELVRQAAQYRQHAEQAIAKKDFHSAVQYLREAVRLHESGEVQERLGDALSMNPHWRRKAEEAYLRAMELMKFRPDIPFKLGALYARSGAIAKARQAFEKALELQPDHDEAKAALKDLKKR